MGTDTLTYRLYGGSSSDGRGYPQYLMLTQDRKAAKLFLKNVAKDPYSFGHVVISHEHHETTYHREADLP